MNKYKKYIVVLVLCLTVLSGCNLPGLKNSNSDDDVKITSLGTSESQYNIMQWQVVKQICQVLVIPVQI